MKSLQSISSCVPQEKAWRWVNDYNTDHDGQEFSCMLWRRESNQMFLTLLLSVYVVVFFCLRLLCSCPDFHHERFTVKGHSRGFRGGSSFSAPHARDPEGLTGPADSWTDLSPGVWLWIREQLCTERQWDTGLPRWCHCYKYVCVAKEWQLCLSRTVFGCSSISSHATQVTNILLLTLHNVHESWKWVCHV